MAMLRQAVVALGVVDQTGCPKGNTRFAGGSGTV